MSVLERKHGTTAIDARNAIQAKIRELGYDSWVNWQGNEATASAGMGLLLDLRGHITDESVVIDKCRGGIGGLVLGKCQEIFEQLFPEANSSTSRGI
jgi:hypothetical protein